MKKNNTARTVIALLFFCTTPQMPAQAQEGELCQGHHWTEDEANLMMKRFGEQWDDLQSWEQRAERIRKGITEGMKLDQMPVIEGNFKPIIKKNTDI